MNLYEFIHWKIKNLREKCSKQFYRSARGWRVSREGWKSLAQQVKLLNTINWFPFHCILHHDFQLNFRWNRKNCETLSLSFSNSQRTITRKKLKNEQLKSVIVRQQRLQSHENEDTCSRVRFYVCSNVKLWWKIIVVIFWILWKFYSCVGTVKQGKKFSIPQSKI